MSDRTYKTLTYLINLSFFLYFLILIIERVISVSLTFVNGINIYGDTFNGYVYTLVFLSISSFFIYLIVRCRKNIIGLFKPDVLNEDIDYKEICMASGLLLLSGMVHTEYTIPVIQFISYGILIAGMLLKTITNPGRTFMKWMSFVYIVCLSMAIPVVYHSEIAYNTLFHILEGISSFVLVGIFTYLLIMIFDELDDLFYVPTIFLTVLLNTPLIVLRWEEEINYFVLIFTILSFTIFLVGYIYKKVKEKK